MSFRFPFKVLLLSLLSVSLTSLAQPGPPPGVRPPPPPQATPDRPTPRATPNHPAVNIPGPIARLPHGAQELNHHGSQVFHHNGKFYSRQSDGFRNIEPPIGMEIKRLPNRAKRVSRGIYRYNNVYYERIGVYQYRVISAP